MYLAFSLGSYRIRTMLRTDYEVSIFAAHKRLIDEEQHHPTPEESALWGYAENALIKLCNYHADLIRNELNLGTQWDWDYEEE